MRVSSFHLLAAARDLFQVALDQTRAQMLPRAFARLDQTFAGLTLRRDPVMPLIAPLRGWMAGSHQKVMGGQPLDDRERADLGNLLLGLSTTVRPMVGLRPDSYLYGSPPAFPDLDACLALAAMEAVPADEPRPVVPVRKPPPREREVGQLVADWMGRAQEWHLPAPLPTFKELQETGSQLYRMAFDLTAALSDFEIVRLGFQDRHSLACQMMLRGIDWELKGVYQGRFPRFVSSRWLRRMTEQSDFFRFEFAYTHGSTSASLPGLLRYRGLLPIGDIVTSFQRPVFVFSEESGAMIGLSLHGEGYVSCSCVSMMMTTWGEKNARSPILRMYRQGKADLEYTCSRTGVWSPELARLTQTRVTEYPEWVDFLERQMIGWNLLTEPERELVRLSFPVIYQGRDLDEKRLGDVESMYPGERGYQGRLEPGQKLSEIFVPEARVAQVKGLLGKNGYENTQVLPIELLLLSRWLFSPTRLETADSTQRFTFDPDLAI